MNTINLYSSIENEISQFLNKFNSENNIPANTLEWEKTYSNPIEMADIIGVFVDNSDKFKINMWVSIDEGFWMNITNYNANNIIKYLYERFPY